MLTPPSPWAALLPAALAGTRRTAAPVSLPGLTPGLGAEANSAEKQLLLTAANLALVQRASQRPQPGPAEALPPPLPETWPAVPEAAVQDLESLLAEQPDGADAWGEIPYTSAVRAALLDLRRQGYRLPFRTALHVLRTWRARDTDAITARRVLGERGFWLNALAGENAHWHLHVLGHDWTTLTPSKRYAHLAHQMQLPMPLDNSYLPQLVEMPAKQRTRLLWKAWQANCGHTLPPLLQAELNTLLAATPPDERPWTTQLEEVPGVAGHPRLVGHPLLARLAEWTAPLLQLEQVPGRPPRVRIELPTALDPAWKKAGMRHPSLFFSHSGELEACLQELLSALAPRHWADAWQRPRPK